nr:hypothetical protein CFP56_02848 [Quercus suber]
MCLGWSTIRVGSKSTVLNYWSLGSFDLAITSITSELTVSRQCRDLATFSLAAQRKCYVLGGAAVMDIFSVHWKRSALEASSDLGGIRRLLNRVAEAFDDDWSAAVDSPQLLLLLGFQLSEQLFDCADSLEHVTLLRRLRSSATDIPSKKVVEGANLANACVVDHHILIELLIRQSRDDHAELNQPEAYDFTLVMPGLRALVKITSPRNRGRCNPKLYRCRDKAAEWIGMRYGLHVTAAHFVSAADLQEQTCICTATISVLKLVASKFSCSGIHYLREFDNCCHSLRRSFVLRRQGHSTDIAGIWPHGNQLRNHNASYVSSMSSRWRLRREVVYFNLEYEQDFLAAELHRASYQNRKLGFSLGMKIRSVPYCGWPGPHMRNTL